MWLATDRESWGEAHAYLGTGDGRHDKCAGVCQILESDSDVLVLIGVFNGEVATLAHEVLHACFQVFDFAGASVTDGKANEAFCYLHTYLMREFLGAVEND